ncbi:MAG: glutamate racemase [Chloroflexi bacterium]|nr:glutamate racemase [Chloroflexota bacterium]
MANGNPIGVFDSGVGGLAVVAELRKLMPDEDVLYYADHAHFPYGSKDPETVRRYALEVAGELVRRGAKLIVVACNTASSVALGALRATYPVPFVGIVPAVKPAALTSPGRCVGVLATEATFRTQVYADLVAQFAQGVRLVQQPCPDVVAAVEAGEINADGLTERMRAYLTPMLAQGVDTLVLGCTHYSFVRSQIEQIVGPGVTVIDASLPVARQSQRVLTEQGAGKGDGVPGKVTYLTSGSMDDLRHVLARLYPDTLRDGLTEGSTVR